MSCPLFEEALLYITSNGANEMMFFSHMFFWLCSYRGRDSRHKTLDMFSLLKFWWFFFAISMDEIQIYRWNSGEFPRCRCRDGKLPNLTQHENPEKL